MQQADLQSRSCAVFSRGNGAARMRHACHALKVELRLPTSFDHLEAYGARQLLVECCVLHVAT